MNKEEITNSQDYKATKVALEWWYSLPEEQRKATDINAEPDIVDAYSDGVIYGWNHPNWISVEDELPQKHKEVLVYISIERRQYVARLVDVVGKQTWWYRGYTQVFYVTHWMPLPQLPRKEE